MKIASALQSRKPVIPVLVAGAHMPRADELPPELARLTHYQAIELRDTHWDEGVERLTQALVMAGLAVRPQKRSGIALEPAWILEYHFWFCKEFLGSR